MSTEGEASRTIALAVDPDKLWHHLAPRFACGDLQSLAVELRILASVAELPDSLHLFVLDADMRIGIGPIERLTALSERMSTESADPNLRLWASALVAEHHLWRFQLESVLIAQSSLSGAPQPTNAFGQYAHARLTRVAALAHRFDGASMDDGPERTFALLGLNEEVVATQLVHGVVVSSTANDDEFENTLRRVLRESAAGVSLTVDRKFLGWYAHGWAALWLDDTEGVDRAVVGMQTTLPVGSVWFQRLLEVFETIQAVLSGAPESEVVDRVERLVRASRDAFINLPGFLVHLARVLLDRGLTVPAARVLGAISVTGFAVSEGLRLIVRESSSRLRLLEDPSELAVAAVDEVLAGWQQLDLQGPYRWCALRLARDCDRVGLADDAARFQDLAEDEGSMAAGLIERVASRPSRTAVTGVREIRLLGPELALVGSAGTIDVSGMPALLLAHLAVERRPIAVERLITLLWPDESGDTGRSRLKVHLYRLRRALGLGPNELVVRDRAGLMLQPGDQWSIDLWQLHDALDHPTGGTHGQLDRAVLDLLDVQFPFDERLVEARRELRVKWVRAASLTIRAGGWDPSTAVASVSTLRIDDPDLLYELAASCDATQAPREADALRRRADRLLD